MAAGTLNVRISIFKFCSCCPKGKVGILQATMGGGGLGRYKLTQTNPSGAFISSLQQSLLFISLKQLKNGLC